MKLAIVGSRTFVDYDFFKVHVDEVFSLENITFIVSGGAKGADTMAETYGRKNAIPFIVFPANWNKYKKSAGPIRNKQVVDECDMMIAFLQDGSRGTMNAIQQASKVGKKVIVVRI